MSYQGLPADFGAIVVTGGRVLFYGWHVEAIVKQYHDVFCDKDLMGKVVHGGTVL